MYSKFSRFSVADLGGTLATCEVFSLERGHVFTSNFLEDSENCYFPQKFAQQGDENARS